MNLFRKILFHLPALTLSLVTLTSSAQDLLVYPKRIVFEGTQKKSESINLTNTGKDTARYDISFVQIRMTEDGSFQNITLTDSGQHFASDHLRYFPRKVVLAPNESQIVKIQLQTGKLEQGEYRSHLYFRAVQDVKPAGQEPAKEQEASGISIRLTPVYGITIPTIIRVGESDTRVTISNMAFETAPDGIPIVSLNFNRSGNTSSYGDIEITHVSTQGKKTKVGEISGFAVYTPGHLRKTKIGLTRSPVVDYASGKLVVMYSSRDTGKRVKLAEAELDPIR